MAIALPPPIEPLMVTVAEIRPAADIHVGIGALNFQVADRCSVGTAGIEVVARAARTPSDFIRGLGLACAARGYPAARTAYAVDNDIVFVSVDTGRITAVEAPESLQAFFEPLTRERIISSADLESARVYADTWSERAGEHYAMRLVPDGTGDARLAIDGPTEGRRQIQALGGFTTSGSRFSGRYLADLQVRMSADTGTELLLGGNIGIRPSGESGEQIAGPYRDGSAQLTQVTRAGVFGVDGRYIDFAPSTEAQFQNGDTARIGLDGEIFEAGASWLTVLHADYNARVTLNMRISRTHQTIDFEDQRLFTQRYTEGELTLGIANRIRIDGLDAIEVQGALNVAQGFTSSPFTPPTAASGTYGVARPALRLTYGPTALLVPSIDLNAQFASKSVPQLEQFVLGGAGGQRAFEPGTAVGDQGYAGRLSLSTRPWTFGLLSLKPTLFAEYGAAKARSAPPGPQSATAHRSDAGLEVVLGIGRFVEVTAYAAAEIDSSGPAQLQSDDQRLGARLLISY